MFALLLSGLPFCHSRRVELYFQLDTTNKKSRLFKIRVALSAFKKLQLWYPIREMIRSVYLKNVLQIKQKP